MECDCRPIMVCLISC